LLSAKLELPIRTTLASLPYRFSFSSPETVPVLTAPIATGPLISLPSLYSADPLLRFVSPQLFSEVLNSTFELNCEFVFSTVLTERAMGKTVMVLVMSLVIG